MNTSEKKFSTLKAFHHERLHKFLLYMVLFLSGVSALIYQVVWIRKFGLVFGVHVFSMSTVLTAFMAGLALGSLIFGKLVDKKKNPLKVFYLLEAGISLFAVLFPVLFNGLTELYSLIAKNTYMNPYATQLVRFILAFLFLLIPTTLMGGTLPVIIRYFVRRLRELGNQVSNLYALNNLGAVAGTFMAGFFIIRTFGIAATLYIGASLNIINAVITYVISRKTSFHLPEAGTEEEPIADAGTDAADKPIPGTIIKLVLWVFAIEGFTTLAYEVVWTRILAGYSFDKTTYFYSTIIIGFIFGLSLGSFLISRRIDKMKNLLSAVGFIEICIGLSSVALLFLFSKLAPFLIQKRDLFGTWLANSGKEYLIFFLLLTIPTTLMGMAYPIVSKIYANNIKRLGNRIGIIGFMDTAGSILGSFVAGFLMIPFLGVVKSFMITAVINLLIGLAVIVMHPSMRPLRKTLITALTIVMTVFLYYRIPGNNYFTWWDQLKYKKSWWGEHYERIVYYHEGEAGTVIVRKYPAPEYLALAINGHQTAYTSLKDLSPNRQLGYMPYILHPEPHNAIVIGFGMGVTTSSLIQPGMEEVDLAEICDGVIRAAPVFSFWNRNVIDEPRLNVFEEDGRSLLFMTDKRYDIITSNAIHPRLSNNIYTEDFYRICYDKLTDDGIICQWMPQNWISENEYKSLLKAFINVFPHSTLWYVNEYSTLVIGSKNPLTISYHNIAAKYNDNVTLKADLAEVGIGGPEQFLAQFIFDEEALHAFCEDAVSNTDNNPVVEFSKIISIAPNLEVMAALRDCPTDYEVFLTEITSEEKKAMIRKELNNYVDFMRNYINSIMNNVNRYLKINR
jgi:spermidine synthase